MTNELAAIERLLELAIEFIVKYSFQIIGAIILLMIGLKIASRLSKLVGNICEKKGVDVTLSRFFGSLVKVPNDAGITIPFPQRDIHISSQTPAGV